MKYIRLLAFMMITCLNVTAQDKIVESSGKYQNDAESNNLKGKVQSVTYYDYGVNNTTGALYTNWTSKLVYNYNQAGNIAEWYIYKTTGQLDYHSVNCYNSKGRIVQSAAENGKARNISSYKYNHNNKRNLVETLYREGRISHRIIYNKLGKRDTTYSYTRGEKLNFKTVYRYDKKGNCIKETRYKSNGNLELTHNYVYDAQNNKIADHSYDSTGTKTGKITYIYDKKRNLTFELDSNIRIIGGLPRKKEGKDTYSRTFKYEMFDEQGNWLMKSYMMDDKPIHVTKRKITYY
ncbi:hypothetical protein FW774_01615 (plasmid) [Pedobacter sp. BS3]|uniref:hypothetical protein n=1 Tax=Pedobacter sp. BS3 TaxID=2567937 RepID=UPI0011EEC235|nr:hypothetical protein [Pedobacter sp. BS3]TZF85795.1 hypothetical protein FW774_01615 [Pedobacter sp. BS3]